VKPKVLVACVGNIFLGDDAFGVEVARQLAQLALPEHVKVIDFGIRSYDLAYELMKAWELVVLVDAVSRGGEPGTIYVIEPDTAAIEQDSQHAGFDAHTMNPVSVLQMLKALGGKCGRMLVVGCEPASVEPRSDGQFELSEPVRAGVDEAVRTIQELVARTGRATAA
jgi:hydrogenase maturation protease